MRRALPAPGARVHRWKRRAKNPSRSVLDGVREQLPIVATRMRHYRIPTQILSGPVTRLTLTRLQRELRDATEVSPGVASDTFLQRFRKALHLLLDH